MLSLLPWWVLVLGAAAAVVVVVVGLCVCVVVVVAVVVVVMVAVVVCVRASVWGMRPACGCPTTAIPLTTHRRSACCPARRTHNRGIGGAQHLCAQATRCASTSHLCGEPDDESTPVQPQTREAAASVVLPLALWVNRSNQNNGAHSCCPARSWGNCTATLGRAATGDTLWGKAAARPRQPWLHAPAPAHS